MKLAIGDGNGGGETGSGTAGRDAGLAMPADGVAAAARTGAVAGRLAGFRGAAAPAPVLVTFARGFPAAFRNGRTLAIEQPKLLPPGAACQQPAALVFARRGSYP